MELQNKFEKIVYDATYNCSFDESYVIKQCTIICLEEQIKLLESIDDTHCRCASTNFESIINQLEQQLKLLKK